MRSSSEAALEAARTDWERVLSLQQGSLVLFGREIFSVADTIGELVAFRRGLTDSSRNGADREKLARDVFATRVSEPVMYLLSQLVRERWSKDSDLMTALEELGVQTLLANAEKADRLGGVEEELYRCLRILGEERSLRVVLGDRGYQRGKREELAREVFSETIPETLELVARAVYRAPESTIAQSLNHYIAEAAQRGHHLVASVTVASPLSPEQKERLSRILTSRYGEDVVVHVSVNPRVVGGMRIHVGEDVIDGTLETRISNVRDAITR